MIKRRERRVAERVDGASIACEEHSKRGALAIDRCPKRRPRLNQPLKHGVGELPNTGSRRVRWYAAPSVDCEFDVSPEHPLERPSPFGLEELQIGALRFDEGERAIVEHDADDDRADATALIADAATRAQHLSLAGSEPQDFVEGQIPGKSG